MSAIGGSIESVTISGREFPVAADSEVQRKLGGFENEFQSNGDGTGRLIKTRTGWSLDGITVENDDSRGDQEFLQDVADGNDFIVVGITYASGITYQGTGQLVGEYQSSSQSATSAVALMGPGKLTPQ